MSAEGGYDPDETGDYDTHRDDDDDDDQRAHLLKKWKLPDVPHHRGEMEMKGRTSTSTSKGGDTAETSFIDNTTGERIVYASNKRRVILSEASEDNAAKNIKRMFPHSDTETFLSGMGEDEQTYIKIKKGPGNVYHPLLDRYGDVIVDKNGVEIYKENAKGNFPKTLRNLLGESVTEKYLANVDRIDGLRDQMRELREKAANAVGEERGVYVDEMEGVLKRINEGEQENEAIEERLTLWQKAKLRIKVIFKKYGFTAFAVATAIGTVIGVIVSNLKAGLTKVAKGVGNGLKELGKKLGQILPGMVGAIASFIFRTAGEVIGFLAKNAWLLIVGLVLFAVEQFKNKKK